MSVFFWIYILMISVLTFVVYGLDKYKAKTAQWRISERILLIGVALGGGLGALAAIEFFHHKTIKGSFLWKVWLGIVIWIGMILTLLYQ